MRRFARDNKIHVWIVSHPKKPLDASQAPGLYDITGSANWANKADNGISIFRQPNSDLVEVHVKKIRFKEVGEIGSTEFIYDRICGIYKAKF